MQNVKLSISLFLLTLAPVARAADSTLTVTDRTLISQIEPQQVLTVAWDNPVVNQLRQAYSLSQVQASWQMRDENRALNPQQGDGDQTWAFEAQSHMKYKSSTLWGQAFYNNGRINNMVWNETSETQLVYPYLLADSVGGKRMKVERYSFMGGYADHRGRLSWGGTLGYKAGLYYRNVDPRPRNVTAHLHAAAGIGYRILPGYVAAVAADFVKYKQTNNVAFYSELGSEKLFHLTGFTNHYARFAGTAYDTYYNGHRWGAVVNLHPIANRGAVAAASFSRFTFNNVLTTLNKLPMAHVGHNQLRAEAGWLATTWSLRAHVEASRRVGRENMFGDPSGSVYLQIGEIEQYFENRFSVGIDGLWQHTWGAYSLVARPALDYSHLNQLYMNPTSRLLLGDLQGRLGLKGIARWGRTVNVLALSLAHSWNVDHLLTLSGATSETAGLQRLVEDTYGWQREGRTLMGLAWNTSVPLKAKYALRATASWQHGDYAHGLHRNNVFTAIAIIF